PLLSPRGSGIGMVSALWEETALKRIERIPIGSGSLARFWIRIPIQKRGALTWSAVDLGVTPLHVVGAWLAQVAGRVSRATLFFRRPSVSSVTAGITGQAEGEVVPVEKCHSTLDVVPPGAGRKNRNTRGISREVAASKPRQSWIEVVVGVAPRTMKSCPSAGATVNRDETLVYLFSSDLPMCSATARFVGSTVRSRSVSKMTGASVSLAWVWAWVPLGTSTGAVGCALKVRNACAGACGSRVMPSRFRKAT